LTEGEKKDIIRAAKALMESLPAKESPRPGNPKIVEMSVSQRAIVVNMLEDALR
jgi:hypothetical protein